MKECKKTDCQSNRDGICLGNWSDCPEGKAKVSGYDRYLAMMILILVVILAILLVPYFGETKEEAQTVAEVAAVDPVEEEIQTPEVKHGQYTIFHYTKGGWVNTMYVTDYFIKDRIIYYKNREHTEEFMEVLFDDCLLQPGWIEEADELVEYGYWEYPDEEEQDNNG